MILLTSSYWILISNYVSDPNISEFEIAKNRILSRASDALEISYLKKIYFWVYRELIMISSNLYNDWMLPADFCFEGDSLLFAVGVEYENYEEYAEELFVYYHRCYYIRVKDIN
jgi:hypothetical protein